jgi:hypothetical protein
MHTLLCKIVETVPVDPRTSQADYVLKTNPLEIVGSFAIWIVLAGALLGGIWLINTLFEWRAECREAAERVERIETCVAELKRWRP